MRRSGRARTVLSLTVVALAIAGVASASIPGPDGVIHGCYTKKNGTLRVIDLGVSATCSSSESAISWNQQGPQGPGGAPGPAGPTGPAGAPGAGAVVAIGSAAGPFFESSARVLGPGDDNAPVPLLTAPFSLSVPGFVHIMAYGALVSDGLAQCDGSSATTAGLLYLFVDGKPAETLTGVDNTSSAANGTSSADRWLTAGSHTVQVSFGGQGCHQSASGTTTVSDLHIEGIGY